MTRAFRIIKLSSLGVFFTGLISIIQGCTSKEAGLAAALLFLLQFCSGPVVDETPEAGSTLTLIGYDKATIPPGTNNSSVFPRTCVVTEGSRADGDGTIREWYAMSGGDLGTIKLKIVRPTGNPNEFEVINESSVQTTTSKQALQTYSETITGVKEGDFLAITALSSKALHLQTGFPIMFRCILSDPASGTTFVPDKNSGGGYVAGAIP
jgi:hypothetical protein